MGIIDRKYLIRLYEDNMSKGIGEEILYYERQELIKKLEQFQVELALI